MQNLTALDFVVIALYFLTMIGIGIWSLTKAKSREDYLVAGRRLKFPLFFGCMAALAVGGAVTVGGTGKGYADGIAGLWVGGSLGMGLVVLGMLVSSKLNRMRALSINEVIERNYGATARIFGAILTIIYTVALTVVQVVAMGAILSGIFGMDSKLAAILSGLVVVFYTFLGGMWAVTMTDIVQFIIKTLGIMILVPIFVLLDPRIGGLSGFMEKVPEGHWDFFAYGFDGSLYWVLLYVPGLVIGQDIWQRIFTAKDDRTARVGTLSAGVYSILYALAAVMLGMAVAALGVTLESKSLAFETGVAEFLPMGVAGLLLAAAMAASMSVGSGTILACSTVVYNDIYLRLIKGQKDSTGADATGAIDDDGKVHVNRDVWINRGIALVIGLAIILLSVLIDDIFKALDLAYAFLSGAVFIPVIAGFILKKVSPRAGLWALGLSGVGIAIVMWLGESGVATTWFGEAEGAKWVIGGNYPIMIGMAIGLVTYTIVHLLDQRKITPNLEISERNLADAEAAHN